MYMHMYVYILYMHIGVCRQPEVYALQPRGRPTEHERRYDQIRSDQPRSDQIRSGEIR